jgi:hypothetical protein
LPSVNQVPLPNIYPNAISPQAPAASFTRLIRGNEVMEISNSALRESGLFLKALNSSPRLSHAFQVLEARTLQQQQLQLQISNETQMMVAMAAGDERNAQQKRIDDLTTLQQNVARARISAEGDFENALWEIGINGAKVAAASSTNDTRGARYKNYVLIDAVENSLSNNLGYTRTKVHENGQLGVTTVPSEYLLPLPVDSNDLFLDDVSTFGVQRAPDGLMIKATDDPTLNPIVQLLALPRFGLFYDTGFVRGRGAENGNIAENVSLDSRRAPGAGQTHFFQQRNARQVMNTLPLDLALNTQLLDVGVGQSLQFFAVANNDFDVSQLDVEHLGVRVYNRQLGSAFEGWSLALGTQQSLFGETVLKPMGLTGERTLIGTVELDDSRPQLALHVPFSDYLAWKIGIEDSYDDDIDFAASTTSLNRWPTFATNLTWKDACAGHALHLGGIARSFGFQEASTEREHFATGWGLSAIAKIRTGNSANVFGIAGGNGVGNYIQGVSQAAAADATSIQAISGLGIFAGRQTVWHDPCKDYAVAALNVAYGYSLMDNLALFGGMEDRKLHQGWVNYIRFLSKNVGVGAEYQYGYRRDGSGDVGEDHRFMLLIAIRSGSTQQSTETQSYSAEQIPPRPVTGAGGLDAELGPPAPMDEAGFVRQPSAATIGGRTVDDVVNQYQFGGAAYQQGL